MQRQFIEIAETDWMDCDEDWYQYCNNSPLHDTRTLTGLPKMNDPEYLQYIHQKLLETDGNNYSRLLDIADKLTEKVFHRYTCLVADENFNPLKEDGLPIRIGKSPFTLEAAKKECDSHKTHQLSTGYYLIQRSDGQATQYLTT